MHFYFYSSRRAGPVLNHWKYLSNRATDVYKHLYFKKSVVTEKSKPKTAIVNYVRRIQHKMNSRIILGGGSA